MKNELAALLLALLTAVGFYYLVIAELNAILKTIIVIILLVACSFSLQKLLKIEGEYGLLLIRTKKGLKLLDEIARSNPKLWNFLADTGLVMGFGLSSILLFGREVPRKTILFGIFCLLLFSQFVLPLAAPLAVELINLPGMEQGMGLASGTVAQAAGGIGDGALGIFLASITALMLLSMVFGGVALAGAFALVLKALTILLAISLFAYSALSGVSDGGILAREAPGAAPVLPGINLPFAEGILALAVLLVVHESAHGVLARVGKIPLKSAGLVFLGIVPFGAFVDPDEKKLQKTEADTQNRVLVAGSTANLLTAVLFFLLFLAFYYSVLSAYPTTQMGTQYVEVSGVLANGTAAGSIVPGMKILKWRGVEIHQTQDFRAAANNTREGDPVEIVTDNGTFCLRAGKDGKVGVQFLQKTYALADHVRALSAANPVLPFLFNFIGLTFVLNILVGIVNLLPIPPFDGYRIISLKVGEMKLFGRIKLMDIIIAVVVGAFLANLLPWLWT